MFKTHLLSFVLLLFLSTSVFSGHKMKDDDLELAIDDPKVVEEGRGWYAQRLSLIHI